LITSDLPMVAWSAVVVAVVAGRVAAKAGSLVIDVEDMAGALGADMGRSGSAGRPGVVG
jgi:hypothetical protein